MRKPFDLIFLGRETISFSTVCWQAAFLLSLFINSGLNAAEWSDTNPPINLTHVFDGEINKRGKPVGFHVRSLGEDPQGAKLLRMISKPNTKGVYTGEVEIYDKSVDRWKRKGFTSFFPDRLSKEEIQALILKAYRTGKINKKGKWLGKSGLGFSIQGWLCPKGGTSTCPEGAINTAYPLYKKDQ